MASTPSTSQPTTADLKTSEPDRSHLGLWDTVSIIVGIVIGAGIYETPPLIFSQFSSAIVGLSAWALGGLLAFIGALCYAELATAYPRSGGDYVYLTRAYGRFVGFLFGWAQLAVILTGSIGMMAYVFADYAEQLWSLSPEGKLWCAILPVIVLTLLNVLGVVLGKSAQNFLTAVKIIGLVGVLLAGFLATTEAPLIAQNAAAQEHTFKEFAFAMVLILLTYGGWNDAAFVAAEVRNKKRDIPLALLLGVAIITLVYLAVNMAYLRVLGLEGVQSSKAVAADLLNASMGQRASQLVSMLVMISALGAINGLIFAGSRVYATLGADHGVFAWLAGWNTRTGSPVAALVAQAVITLGMILAVGTSGGQALLDSAFQSVNLAKVDNWAGRSGFGILVQCTAPIFWLFFLLTSISLFVLRITDAAVERPFRVPLYPIVPALFTLTCAYMLYNGIEYAGRLGWVGAALLFIGVPLYIVSKPRMAKSA